MREKEPLKITAIDVSVERQRLILGLENQNAIPVTLSAIVSMLLFVIAPGETFLSSVLSCFMPFGLTTAYILLLKNNKPPHFKEDFFDKYLNGVRGFNSKGDVSIKKKVYEI